MLHCSVIYYKATLLFATKEGLRHLSTHNCVHSQTAKKGGEYLKELHTSLTFNSSQ